MSEQVANLVLLNRQTKAFDPAELWHPMGDKHNRDFETLWRPAFAHRRATMRPGETAADAQLQDDHWEWSKKSIATLNRLDYESFAVTAAGITQGMMLTNLVQRAKITEQQGRHLVYVTLLATAPWNRFGFTNSPVYKGVGRLLLAAAISFSVDQGFGGKAGLHALPQSASWYRDVCRMNDLGPDADYPGMNYFEFTDHQAMAFIT